MRQKQRSWFIEPLDVATDRVLAELSLNGPGPTEAERHICSDGVERPMWPVSEEIKDFLVRSRPGNTELCFVVWVLVGDGALRRRNSQPKRKDLPKLMTARQLLDKTKSP